MSTLVPLSKLLQTLLPTLFTIALVALGLWGLLWLLTRLLQRWRTSLPGAEDAGAPEASAERLHRSLRHTLQGVGTLVVLLIILRNLGYGLPRLSWQEVSVWLAGRGLRILLIAAGALILVRVIGFAIAHLEAVLLHHEGAGVDYGERRKRVNTIGKLLRAVVATVILGSAGLMILRLVDVDITPILTGAGVMGLAIGFGAQNLVRDVISGLFIILENQVRVGDVAVINDKSGLVEAIRLRTIVLRSSDGTVHIFPNGTITQLSNMTKDFSFYVLDLGVGYRENTDRVCGVLREIGEELQGDERFRARILAPLEILGVDKFADAAVILKLRIKTLPSEQWNVGRELLRRIKLRFDAEGIQMPYPTYTVDFSNGGALNVQSSAAAGVSGGGGAPATSSAARG